MEYEQLIRATKALSGLEIAFIVFAIVTFIVSVILFAKYKVPNLISEITGKTRQKRIQQMEAERTNKNISNINLDFSNGSEEVSSNHNKSRNGTISKDTVKNSRRQTSLASNKRKTTVIEHESSTKTNKSSRQTVAMQRKDISNAIVFEVIDELLLINSKEVIE